VLNGRTGRGWLERARGTADAPRNQQPTTRLHVHLYRRLGDDPFSGASLYACRCGVIRPGM